MNRLARQTTLLCVLLAGCSQTPPPFAGPEPEQELMPAPPLEDPLEPMLLTHVLRGLYYLSTGYPSAAVPHLRLGLLYDPASAFVHERLAQAWAASGDLGQARAVLAAGLRRNPTAPGLNLLGGELARRDGRCAEALPLLELALAEPDTATVAAPWLLDCQATLGHGKLRERALELLARAPADAQLAAALAAILEDHAELTGAVELYGRAHEQDPANERHALALARVYSLLGRDASAADVLVSLFAFYPDEVPLYLEVARYFRRAGRPEAKAYRDEALVYAEHRPEALLRVADFDLTEGDRAAGLALLERLLADSPDARLALAEARLDLGEADACLSALRPAPAHPLVQLLRGRCALAGGDLAAGLGELEGALRGGAPAREVVSAAALGLARRVDEAQAEQELASWVRGAGALVDEDEAALGRVVLLDYFDQGREALVIVSQLLEARPDDAELAFRLADLMARYGQLERAIDILETLWRAAPEDPTTLNALGFTLADAGERLPEAEVLIRRAYRMIPEQSFVVDSLAWVLFRRGHAREALPLLERARRASPSDPEILRHLGDVYAALGKPAEARRAYEEALRHAPPWSQRRALELRLTGGT